MVDFTRNVGSAGVLTIRDTGSTVEFWVSCTDPATNVGSYSWFGTINGVGVGGTVSLPAGFGHRLLGSWNVTTTQTVTQGQNATGTMGLGGAASHSASINRTPPAGVPGAPSWSGAAYDVNPFGFRQNFTRGAANGSAIIFEQAEYYNNAGLTGSPIWINGIGNGVYTSPTNDGGLSPNQTVWIRIRSQNGVGWSAWSSTISRTTGNVSPPTLGSVTPNPTGTEAVVVMSLPPEVTAVNSYTIQNRTPGGTWANAATGSANPSQTVTGLTPGQAYEWRVLAVIRAFTSLPSNTITRTQPQPNASPGSYWDGDTPDVAGVTNYAWTGTAGASTSTAQSLRGAAVGWLTGPQAMSFGSGGSAVQTQVPGGLIVNSGAYAARYVILTPTTAPGARFGTDGVNGYAEVSVGGSYLGSIYVRGSRILNLAAMIVWCNGAGAPIATSAPGATGGISNTTPGRLTVLATAPAGAVRAYVVAVTTAATGILNPGDTITVDAAMMSLGTLYPYFDGDTSDTTEFIYSWVGAQYTTPSSRATVPQAAQNPLLDPNCDPLPTPPQPPSIEDDCIVPIGSWRRTWYQITDSDVPEFLAAVPTITLSTFGQAESQVRLRWYQNPECVEPLDFTDTSGWVYEQIISFIPPNSTITLDGVSRRVWAEVPTGAATIPGDELLYGTNGVPASWPTISCEGCWLISMDTALTSSVDNLTPGLALTTRE